MKAQDSYEEPKVFTYPGITIRAYTPILTEEERKIRMNRISKAAEALLEDQR